MAKKHNDGYLSAKESRRISKENRKITNALEKKRKRKNVPESEYLTEMHDPNNAVEFDNLHTYFFTDTGVVKSVDGVTFSVPIGKTVGVVGESGCGKSVTSLSLMQLLQRPQGQVVEGEIVIYIFSALVYDIAIGQRLRCTGKAAGLTGGKAMDCRDSALFTGVDEASCENMLRCFSAYEQRFSAGQTILTCGQQQDMIGVLLSGSAALLRLHADGNRTVLESMDEGSVFGEELAFTGFRDGSALIECREDCRVIFMRYDQITKRCENACACHSQVVTNLFQLLSKKSLHLSRRIEVLACRSIREKLLCFFEQLADEHGSRTFPLPFSLSMLADYISADRSAMMREMRKMREEDLISTEGRSVTLL